MVVLVRYVVGRHPWPRAEMVTGVCPVNLSGQQVDVFNEVYIDFNFKSKTV
jgi:hypothetical protein